MLERTLRVNVVAPLALVQLALPRMPAGARIVNVTSDAAVEAYEGWGGYGLSKAALEQLTGVLAAERPDLRVYAVDPGDMNTRMHQDAFPGEDISDRPSPARACPGCSRSSRATWPAAGTARRTSPPRPMPSTGAALRAAAAPLAAAAARRTSRRRRAAWPATRCGCSSPPATG